MDNFAYDEDLMLKGIATYRAERQVLHAVAVRQAEEAAAQEAGNRETLAQAQHVFSKRYISEALASTKGNVSAASARLGLNRSTLQRNISALGIPVAEFRSSRKPPQPVSAELRVPDRSRLILDLVADAYGLSVPEMKTKTREWRISKPRQLSMLLLRRRTPMSLKAIGMIFGFDHTTVMHGIDRAEKLLTKDKRMRQVYELVQQNFVREKERRLMIDSQFEEHAETTSARLRQEAEEQKHRADAQRAEWAFLRAEAWANAPEGTRYEDVFPWGADPS